MNCNPRLSGFQFLDLMCYEDLNETELLLRERVAGVWKFAAGHRNKDSSEKISVVDVGLEEAKLINALGMYSADDLYSFMNKLKSAVAMVNAEEQSELQRAKVLNIFAV